MKIFCIGRNYQKHAEELNNQVPEQPLIFMKPQTALLKPGQDFYYPDFTSNLHHECELVLKMGKNGKHIAPSFALDYISEVTVGIDFTARDIQSKLKEKGHSWERAKAFDQSAPVGEFFPASAIQNWDDISISLNVNGEERQRGSTKHLLFSIPSLIHTISTYFTINIGDLIFTGTPEGVGPVQIGDTLTASLNNQELLQLSIK